MELSGETIENNFKDRIREKFSSPFFFTYIIVWIVRNWRLIFSFFNLDEGQSLNDKIWTLALRIEPGYFWLNVCENVLYTFFVLSLSYAFIYGTKIITQFFERRFYPWVLKRFDFKDIVPLEEHQKLNKKYYELLSDLERMRESKNRQETGIKDIEERHATQINDVRNRNIQLIDEMNDLKSEHEKEIEDYKIVLNDANDKFKNLLDDKDLLIKKGRIEIDRNKAITTESQNQLRNLKQLKNDTYRNNISQEKVDRVVEMLLNNDISDRFLQFVETITPSGVPEGVFTSREITPLINLFKNLEVIEETAVNLNNSTIIKVTDLGGLAYLRLKFNI